MKENDQILGGMFKGMNIIMGNFSLVNFDFLFILVDKMGKTRELVIQIKAVNGYKKIPTQLNFP